MCLHPELIPKRAMGRFFVSGFRFWLSFLAFVSGFRFWLSFLAFVSGFRFWMRWLCLNCHGCDSKNAAMKKVTPKKARTSHYATNHRLRVLQSRDLSLGEVAKRLDYSETYIQKVFRNGNAPYHLAKRLSRLLNCQMEFFL
jgi:hypothetical protein